MTSSNDPKPPPKTLVEHAMGFAAPAGEETRAIKEGIVIHRLPGFSDVRLPHARDDVVLGHRTGEPNAETAHRSYGKTQLAAQLARFQLIVPVVPEIVEHEPSLPSVMGSAKAARR